MLGYAGPAPLQIVLPDPTPLQLSPDRSAQAGRADSRGILVHFSPLSPGPQSSSEPPHRSLQLSFHRKPSEHKFC